MANPNPFKAHAAIRAKGIRNSEQYRWFVAPLYAQGLGYRQIARTCESYRLLTPGGATQWTHEMVRLIVKRLGLVRSDERQAA